MTKLTLEDLEAMRRHYGIAQEEEEDLQGDLGQVGVLWEVGIGLERWAWLRGLPMEYALALGSTSTRRRGGRGEPRRAGAVAPTTYSPDCSEEEFCELLLCPILGSPYTTSCI